MSLREPAVQGLENFTGTRSGGARKGKNVPESMGRDGLCCAGPPNGTERPPGAVDHKTNLT